MKKITSLLLIVLLGIGLVGCGGDTDKKTDGDLSGKISLNGSTSMEKYVNALGETFMKKNPGVTVESEFTGSSSGIEALLAGTADIGNSSRNLKDEEKTNGAVENIVAIDGIAVIVNNENAVKDLSKENLIKVYKGEITNWKEVGGKDESIVVIGRESASGTRGAFEELLDIEGQCKYAQEIDSTGAVVGKVAEVDAAIGYISLDVVNDTVTALKLDGVEATEANIQSGSYFLKRPFVMATKGEISEQSELVKAFFEFVESEEGQEVLKQTGLISPK